MPGLPKSSRSGTTIRQSCSPSVQPWDRVDKGFALRPLLTLSVYSLPSPGSNSHGRPRAGVSLWSVTRVIMAELSFTLNSFSVCVGGGGDDITCMWLYVAAIGKSQTLLFGSHPPCFLRQDPPLAKQSRPADRRLPESLPSTMPGYLHGRWGIELRSSDNLPTESSLWLSTGI